MRKHLWALLLMAAMPLVGQQAGMKQQDKMAEKSGNAVVEQKLMQKEKGLWEAWKNKNAQPFHEETATNVPGVSMHGLVSTDQMTEEMQKCNVTSYSLEDARTDWVGNDVAVLTYKANQDATCDGKKVPSTVWAQSVWAKKDGKWVAVSHQEVPAGGGEKQAAETPQ